ncbi:MAG: hypothetical protein SNJ73_10310 [Acetobacteraceae bacterium]
MATTATILRFPVRPRQTPAAEEVSARAAAALLSLQSALAEQRSAIAEFRAALGALGTMTSGIGSGLVGMSQALDGLQRDVRSLGERSRELEGIADRMLAVAASPTA